MSICAIIPVKKLTESKSRLSQVLSADERAKLVAQFLRHELEVLRQVAAIEEIVVVSSALVILALAQENGATVLPEEQSEGINVAVTRAVAWAREEGGKTAVLILPVDLPFLHPDDITRLLAAYDDQRLVISPDGRHEGTNALLLPPLAAFTFHYGPHSLQKHLAEAQMQQLQPHVIPSPGLLFDVDTLDDWYAYQQHVAATPILLNQNIRFFWPNFLGHYIREK